MGEVGIGFDDVAAAAERIRGRVRHTPTIQLRFASAPALDGMDLVAKLDCLQVSGSFKARGATNKALSLSADQLERGLVTASAGNHGLAVAAAAMALGASATIFLPGRATAEKERRLIAWGARVVRVGTLFDDAYQAARESESEDGLTFLHPFADPLVIAGQGTAALEFLTDAPRLDTVVVAIGGGGLISGMAIAARHLNPRIRVIGVQAEGADAVRRSVAEGRLVTLDEIRTDAISIAPRRSEPLNLELISRLVDEIVTVDDAAMQSAARLLWFEAGIGVELAGGATLAAVMSGAIRPRPGERVGLMLCGMGADGVH